VGEWNLSRTEGVVQEWHVAEDGDQSSLEEETEVSESVVHALLGKGQVSGLADHEISPLHADDGDEVTGLSELEGLSGVANGPAGDAGVLIEAGRVTAEWPSARSPGIGRSVLGVEESDIDLSVLCFVPSDTQKVII
jgi:hypothetical protein